MKSHDWMQRLSAARSYVFSFGNWGVGSALLSYAKTSSVSHARRGVRRVGHHRRDVRVLPTHPTLETKNSQQIKLNTICETTQGTWGHTVNTVICLWVLWTQSQDVLKLEQVTRTTLRQSRTTNPDAVTLGAWTRREQERRRWLPTNEPR